LFVDISMRSGNGIRLTSLTMLHFLLTAIVLRIVPVLIIQIAICLADAAQATKSRELADFRNVRSLASEAAEVLQLRADNKINATYAQVMTDNARDQLRDLDKSAGKTDPELHQAISESMTALARGDAAVLRTIAQRLFAMAGPRGPAD
jgi:hypothetical protein